MNDAASDLVQQAIDHIRAGDADTAHGMVIRAVRADDQNALAWAVLAHLTYRPEAPQEAIYCLKQVLRLQPNNLQAWEYLSTLGASPDAPGQWQTPLPESPPRLPLTNRDLFDGGHDDPTIKAPAPETPPERRRLQRMLVINGGTALLVLVLLLGLAIPLRWMVARLDWPAAPGPPETPTSQGVEPASEQAAPAMTDPPAATPPSTSALPAGQNAPGTATAAPALDPVDYAPLAAELGAYFDRTAREWHYDLGLGFVDLQTGQVIQIDGDSRYHAMSTFKAPLAAYYFWVVEHDQNATLADYDRIQHMIRESSNPATTCVFQRVGGIAAFNDWLAYQGMNRENNFVFKWQDWACDDQPLAGIPAPDWRYAHGDDLLGLPGDNALLTCPTPLLPCDKAFAPADLAQFYARLYRGEVLSAENTAQLFTWLEPRLGGSIFLESIPRQAGARVYVKGGGRQADDEYRVNFLGEAGIVETPYGAFALAIFMQRNPDWPGSEVVAGAVEIVYRHFTAAHAVYTP